MGTTPRERVLIVVSSDGFLQAYAPKHVDIHFAQLLDMGPESEILAEQYMEARLPACYKPLFLPRFLRQTALVEKVSAEQELERVWRLSIVSGLRRFAG